MVRLLSALAVTVALGLASRLYPTGWFPWDRILGDVLYAVAAYLAWAMILFREPPWLVAAIAFACCSAVELFKLTGIPRENQHLFLVRWFLGMVFDPVNLVYYFTGAALAACADSATRGSRQGRKGSRAIESHKKAEAVAAPERDAGNCSGSWSGG